MRNLSRRIWIPAFIVFTVCSCSSSDTPPTSAEVLVVPTRDSGRIAVHLVLRDAAAGITRADGAAVVEVVENRSDPYAETGEAEVQLYRGQFPVLRSRFRKIVYQKKDLFAFPVGHIPLSEFFEAPTQPVGTVRIKFRARYSEEDIVGETAVRLSSTPTR